MRPTKGTTQPFPDHLLSISLDIFTAPITDTSKPAFPQFSLLPAEVRCLVWYHALPEARVLEMRTPYAPPQMSFAIQNPHYSTNEPNPVLLQVNYEARRECLRYYSPLFSRSTPPLGLPADKIASDSSPLAPFTPLTVNVTSLLSRLRFAPPPIQESNIYIDCRRDTLYFDRCTSVTRHDPSAVHVLARFLPLLTPHARQHIRHLALDANLRITYASPLRKAVIQLLHTALPRLDQLALVELADGLDYERVTNYRQEEGVGRKRMRCARLLAMEIQLLDLALPGQDGTGYEYGFGHMWFPADWSRVVWMREWWRLVRRERAMAGAEGGVAEGETETETPDGDESDADTLAGDEDMDDEDRVVALGLGGESESGRETGRGNGWGLGMVGVPMVQTVIMRRGGEVFL